MAAKHHEVTVVYDPNQTVLAVNEPVLLARKEEEAEAVSEPDTSVAPAPPDG